jgi:protein-tyrosine phosphatase
VVYEILPGQLFQRGKLHGKRPDQIVAGLNHYGITETYALAPTTADPFLSQWLEERHTYRHQPIPDGRLKVDLLEISVELARHIEHGGRVLTMCNAGRNRSGLLSALIVRELTGLPGAAAMQVVRTHRPNAIANPHFEAFLRSLP